MAIIWAGNEMDAFDRIGPLEDVANDTTAGARDSNYCSGGALRLNNYAWAEVDFTAMTELWFHCEYYPVSVSVGTTQPFIMFVDAATGRTAFQFDCDGSTVQWNFEYWDGAAYVEITAPLGSADTLNSSTKYVLDFHIKIANSGGILEYYRGGVLKHAFYGDTLNAGFTQISRLCLGAAAGAIFSQMIIADQSTIGMHVSTLAPSAAGTDAQWTGAYTDIDDVVADGSKPSGTPTYITDATAGHKTSFNVTNPSATAARLNALAVVACARVRSHGAAPNVSIGLRTSGQFWNSGGTYLGSSLAIYQNPDNSLQCIRCVYHADPVLEFAGSWAQWTPALLNALEWEVEIEP